MTSSPAQPTPAPAPLANQGAPKNNPGFFRKLAALKTRTKLLGIFIVMFIGLFYTNTVITQQARVNGSFIESQSKIITDQTTLSDTIRCFGAIKYWFAILDNGLKKNPVELPTAAEKGVKCDLEQFGDHLKNLETFSPQARDVNVKYEKIRDLPRDAMTAYIEGDAERGQTSMAQAYNLIAEIDEGLSGIAKKLNNDSAETSSSAMAQLKEFKKFPLMFMVSGAIALILISWVTFFNIFHPIENIISTMMDASHDPHNTKDYIVPDKGRTDEVGDIIAALNRLLLQVHEGFRRTKEAEQEIAATARRLDAVFNSVADALITINAAGEIESINKSACKIFDCREEDFLGRKIIDFFPAAIREKYVDSLTDFARTGQGELIETGPKEALGKKTEGTEFPIELSITNLSLDDGSSVFVNVIRDITQRKDLERQLLQAQKMEALGSLSSGIAHEINTPAQYVRDNIKFLQDAFGAYDTFYRAITPLRETPPVDTTAFKEAIDKAEAGQDLAFFSDEAKSALAQSLDGVEKISEIVGAIKGFSYPANEEIIYIDLNEALKNTIIVSRNQWKSVAHLETEFDENLPPIPCIPGKLTQVILNLIVNATHAIEEKGDQDAESNAIVVSTSATDKKATIKVRDSGCGIPKENMTKIFNPFFTTKEVGKGTGQGLSISYDIIVKKHGGTLQVESEVGKGTTFIIELPLETEAIKAAAKNNKSKKS